MPWKAAEVVCVIGRGWPWARMGPSLRLDRHVKAGVILNRTMAAHCHCAPAAPCLDVLRGHALPGFQASTSRRSLPQQPAAVAGSAAASFGSTMNMPLASALRAPSAFREAVQSSQQPRAARTSRPVLALAAPQQHFLQQLGDGPGTGHRCAGRQEHAVGPGAGRPRHRTLRRRLGRAGNRAGQRPRARVAPSNRPLRPATSPGLGSTQILGQGQLVVLAPPQPSAPPTPGPVNTTRRRSPRTCGAGRASTHMAACCLHPPLLQALP